MPQRPPVLSPKQPNSRQKMQTITRPMPRIGFGVYKIHPSRCEAACLAALDVGYRHLDAAQLYRSESQVASAVARSGVPRADIFLTTKIKTWRGGSGEELHRSLLESVRKLGGEGEDAYVDLFLVHTPWFKSGGARREVWLALERLKEEGRARAIGVSNYGIQHLEEMRDYMASWPPSVNQIELHPWCQQRELVKYCQEHGITIQAYSPLATGARLGDTTLCGIAERYGRSPTQVLLRYSLQKGWVPLPKSESPERMRENFDVLDFELDEAAVSLLDGLDEGKDGALFPANVSG